MGRGLKEGKMAAEEDPEKKRNPGRETRWYWWQRLRQSSQGRDTKWH